MRKNTSDAGIFTPYICIGAVLIVNLGIEKATVALEVLQVLVNITRSNHVVVNNAL